MKIRHRIQTVPDGSPYAGATVSMRRVADSSTITTLGSDSDGWVDYQANGNPGPYYLYVGGLPGGDRFLDSRDAMTAGVLSLAELPVALRTLGDGVVRGYANALQASVGADTITVATGAANVIGHPFVAYTPTAFSYARPVSGTRIDRVIVRLYPEGGSVTPGKSDLVLLAGVVDAGAPALTQTATVYEISLAAVTVPAAGAVTVTDERTWANESIQEGNVVRAATASTASGSGEALAGLSLTLVLPKAATYDIHAKVSARQTVSAWVLQATIGESGSGNGQFQFSGASGQVAVDSSGNVYVADAGNSRVQKFNASGVWQTNILTGLNNVKGVAVDASGNIYTAHSGGHSKHTSAGVHQWTNNLVSDGAHVATDGTHVYITQVVGDTVRKRLCSDGSSVAIYGASGSGDGQFQSPYGIAYSSATGTLYVVDGDNKRIQELTTTGAFVRKWGTTGSGDGQFLIPVGIAIDNSGDVWVCDAGNNRLQRFSAMGTFQVSIAQTSPRGIAVASGDVLWVSSGQHNLAKWDEQTGYGEIAVEIDGNLGTYLGIGDRNGAVGNAHFHSVAGPKTVVVRAFGRATEGTMTLEGIVLSARAMPRR